MSFKHHRLYSLSQIIWIEYVRLVLVDQFQFLSDIHGECQIPQFLNPKEKAKPSISVGDNLLNFVSCQQCQVLAGRRALLSTVGCNLRECDASFLKAERAWALVLIFWVPIQYSTHLAIYLPFTQRSWSRLKLFSASLICYSTFNFIKVKSCAMPTDLRRTRSEFDLSHGTQHASILRFRL